jgi:hypothetical protein
VTRKPKDTTPGASPEEKADETALQPASAGGASARKERVIHTRVPAVLEEELKRLAESLRIPVSNVIRTILEDAVAMADRAGDRVEHELRSVAEHIEAERRKLGSKLPRRDPLEGVFGFQALTMNLDSACARCGALIQRGEDAFLGLTDPPGRRVLVCVNCVPESPGRDGKGERR